VDSLELQEKLIRQKLKNDFPHYAERCLRIRPKSGRIQTFSLNPVQQKLHDIAETQLKETNRVRILVLKARQPGVSTYVEGRFYWKATHSRGARAFILTHKDDATDNLFEMAKRFHANCPPVVKPQTAASNAKELKFGLLDSSYRVGTAKADGVGRSDTIQFFHGSEVAHWPNADKHAAGALQAVPDVDGTEIWLESTANGANGLFYNMCLKAEQGDGDYRLVFIPWFDHAEYKKMPSDGWLPGEVWRDYGRMYGLTREQLYWAYAKNVDLAGSIGESLDRPCWLFRQEYPATAQDAFQTSGENSFIAADHIAHAMENDYPEPASDVPVVFGVDIAHGGGDKTRIIDRWGRRLGHLVNETLDEADEMVIAGRLVNLMDRFGPAMVFVDTTGGYGAGVVDRLHEQGYRNIRGVNFGARAADADRFANKRAEMWANLRDWIKDGADVADDPLLRRHLAAPTAKPDSSGRLLLEKKEDIRKRLGLSPDGGDAAALTFAEPVRRGGAGGRGPDKAESEYDLMGF